MSKSKYLTNVEAWFKNIENTAAAEPNPHRKAILLNYLEHAALEYSDRWEEIFTPDRTVEHPVYHVKWGTPDVVIHDGMDAVKTFYAALKDQGVLTDQDEYLSVDDWGFSSFLTICIFMPGRQLLDAGSQVDDPDAMYVVMQPTGMYWLYDERARLIGERVYEIAPPEIVKCAPEDVVTEADIETLIAPYLPEPAIAPAAV
jgi:hypothetical protein